MAERDVFDDRPATPSPGYTDLRPQISGVRALPDVLSNISGYFLGVLQNYFGEPERCMIPQCRRLLWHPDPRQRKIVIEEFSRWDPKTSGTLPSIVIDRGPCQSKRLGIHNEVMQTGTPIGVKTGVKEWEGTHRFYCTERGNIPADFIASEIRQFLQAFEQEFCHDLCLSYCEVLGMGQSEPPKRFQPKDAKDLFAVEVTLGYTLLEHWELVPEGPLIRRASLDNGVS